MFVVGAAPFCGLGSFTASGVSLCTQKGREGPEGSHISKYKTLKIVTIISPHCCYYYDVDENGPAWTAENRAVQRFLLIGFFQLLPSSRVHHSQQTYTHTKKNWAIVSHQLPFQAQPGLKPAATGCEAAALTAQLPQLLPDSSWTRFLHGVNVYEVFTLFWSFFLPYIFRRESRPAVFKPF